MTAHYVCFSDQRERDLFSYPLYGKGKGKQKLLELKMNSATDPLPDGMHVQKTLYSDLK